MRDRCGRYLPGNSGNHQGRPKGSISRLGQELQEAAAEILPLWIAAALKGDTEKQQFLLERGLPRLRSQLSNIEIEVEGGNDAEKIRHLFAAAAKGDISSTTASEMATLLTNAIRVEEIETLKNEVAALKTILNNRRKRGSND